jgi:hypothetical protein
MEVQFKRTTWNADTHCCICGQGFELIWDQQPGSDCASALFEIQKSLCNHHHRDQKGPEAHPQSGYLFPEWKRLPHDERRGQPSLCTIP